jgi:hypothetical protein
MSPRDFLEDNQQNMSSPNVAGSPRDFLPDNEEVQASEGLGTSAAMAIPRILTDLGKGVYHAAQSIPSYWEKAKTEVPGLLNPNGVLRQHPLHALGQGFAGVNEAINSLAQAPLALSRYGTERLNLVPQGVTNALQKITPEDTTQAINQLFGEPKYPGEAALRGGFRNIPALYGAGKLATAIKPSALLTTKKNIKNSLLKPHDALESRANNAFKEVSNQVNSRGINQLPIEDMSSVNFENMRSYFPATRQYDKLLTGAEYGDYNSLRKLQSDLYSKGKQNLGSNLEVDRMKGAEMLERRNDINEAISNHLIKTGNTDLADILQGARNDWRTLQNTYYNENMNNALVNMFNKQYRKVPNNLVDILGEESIPMKNLLDFHPGLETKVNRYKVGQNIRGKAVKYGIPAAAAFAGYEYGKPGGR